MVIDMHTHLFGRGWVPKAFYYGVARFITHAFAKQGVRESAEEIGNALMDSTDDPAGEMLLAEMQEAGIDLSVVFPVDFGLALGEPEVPIQQVNREMALLAQRHPRKLIAFAGIDPRRSNALQLFQQCVEEWGMKGLKLHPSAGFYPNQKEVYPLLEQASLWKLPVIIHSGSMMVPLRSKYSQAIHFDDLGVDFPDLSIIAAHAGGSLGYVQMLSIMNVKLNILVDISGWQIPALKNYNSFCRSLRNLMDFAEPERILFGSDSPSFRSMMSNSDWVSLLKKLPEQAPAETAFTPREIESVLGRNAEKLLSIMWS